MIDFCKKYVGAHTCALLSSCSSSVRVSFMTCFLFLRLGLLWSTTTESGSTFTWTSTLSEGFEVFDGWESSSSIGSCFTVTPPVSSSLVSGGSVESIKVSSAGSVFITDVVVSIKLIAEFTLFMVTAEVIVYYQCWFFVKFSAFARRSPVAGF